MEEKKLRQITASASFAFAICCLLWVALSNLLLPVIEGQKDYSLMVIDPDWTLVALVGLLSTFFGIFAVFGIYHANRARSGILLFIGMVFLVLGLALEWAGLTWDIFIWPVLCANSQYISFVRDGILVNSTQFLVFLILMLVSLFLGNILTALALLKTKKYGKVIPLSLMLGILLYGIGSVVHIYIATVGLCIYSLAFVLIGVRLWRE